MGRNRYNKPQGDPIDYSPKKKVVDEPTLSFSPCMICHKAIKQGYYGSWANDQGTCSLECEKVQQSIHNQGVNHEISLVTAFNGNIYRES